MQNRPNTRRQAVVIPTGRSPEQCRRTVCSDLDLDPDVLIILAVDRLDHMKRIQDRFLIAERVIELGMPAAFVQLLSPTGGAQDVGLAQQVQTQVTRINERFGDGQAGPIFSVIGEFEPDQVYDYYAAADLFYMDAVGASGHTVEKPPNPALNSSASRELFMLKRPSDSETTVQEVLVIDASDIGAAAHLIVRALTVGAVKQPEHKRSLHAIAMNGYVYH